jgi:hypothetical protein
LRLAESRTANNVVPAQAGTHTECLKSSIAEYRAASDEPISIPQHGFPLSRE